MHLNQNLYAQSQSISRPPAAFYPSNQSFIPPLSSLQKLIPSFPILSEQSQPNEILNPNRNNFNFQQQPFLNTQRPSRNLGLKDTHNSTLNRNNFESNAQKKNMFSASSQQNPIVIDEDESSEEQKPVSNPIRDQSFQQYIPSNISNMKNAAHNQTIGSSSFNLSLKSSDIFNPSFDPKSQQLFTAMNYSIQPPISDQRVIKKLEKHLQNKDNEEVIVVSDDEEELPSQAIPKDIYYYQEPKLIQNDRKSNQFDKILQMGTNNGMKLPNSVSNMLVQNFSIPKQQNINNNNNSEKSMFSISKQQINTPEKLMQSPIKPPTNNSSSNAPLNYPHHHHYYFHNNHPSALNFTPFNPINNNSNSSLINFKNQSKNNTADNINSKIQNSNSTTNVCQTSKTNDHRPKSDMEDIEVVQKSVLQETKIHKDSPQKFKEPPIIKKIAKLGRPFKKDRPPAEEQKQPAEQQQQQSSQLQQQQSQQQQQPQSQPKAQEDKKKPSYCKKCDKQFDKKPGDESTLCKPCLQIKQKNESMEKRYWELVFLGSDEKMNITPVGQDYQARIPDFEVLTNENWKNENQSKLETILASKVHSSTDNQEYTDTLGLIRSRAGESFTHHDYMRLIKSTKLSFSLMKQKLQEDDEHFLEAIKASSSTTSKNQRVTRLTKRRYEYLQNY